MAGRGPCRGGRPLEHGRCRSARQPDRLDALGAALGCQAGVQDPAVSGETDGRPMRDLTTLCVEGGEWSSLTPIGGNGPQRALSRKHDGRFAPSEPRCQLDAGGKEATLAVTESVGPEPIARAEKRDAAAVGREGQRGRRVGRRDLGERGARRVEGEHRANALPHADLHEGAPVGRDGNAARQRGQRLDARRTLQVQVHRLSRPAGSAKPCGCTPAGQAGQGGSRHEQGQRRSPGQPGTRRRGWLAIVQLQPGVRNVVDTPTAVLLEASADHPPHGRRHRVRHQRPVGLPFEHLGEHLSRVITWKRSMARKHLVAQAAKGPDVCALIHIRAASLFGRHVGRRAPDDPSQSLQGRRALVQRPASRTVGRKRTANVLRNAEIEHLDGARAAEADIGRLEVAVHDAAIVCRFERQGDLPRDGRGVGRPKRPAAQQFPERGALDQLHHQGGVRVDVLEAVYRRDVGVRERREDLGLASEPREPFRVRLGIVQHLDGDVAP